jgi:TrmH family RNA methyltransferase
MISSMPVSSQSGQRLRPISSRQNALLKKLREAFAQGTSDDGFCAVEGIRLIEEAIRSRLKVHALFVRQSAQARAERILDQLSKHAEALLVPNDVFDRAAVTEHPQGIAALVQIPHFQLQAALASSPALVIVAAGIQDPGNLGTLIRSAEAFGAGSVISTEGTVDQWNSKVIRASAGSVFRLPVVKTGSDELIFELRARQISAIALVAPRNEGTVDFDGSTPQKPRRLHDADLTRACALFTGNEGRGIPRELVAAMDEFAAIPQARVESLNAGVAASIALYEAQRQRSARP